MHLLALQLDPRDQWPRRRGWIRWRRARLSFAGALHTVRAFEESHLYEARRIAADLPRLAELIGQKRIGDRPDRYEPRAVKRRPKPHPLLRMSRREAQRLIRDGQIPYSKGQEDLRSEINRKSFGRIGFGYPSTIPS